MYISYNMTNTEADFPKICSSKWTEMQNIEVQEQNLCIYMIYRYFIQLYLMSKWIRTTSNTIFNKPDKKKQEINKAK